MLPEIIRSYEKLSETIMRIRRQAVKRLRKKKAGGDPWSPTLRDYIARVDFWSRMVKKRLGVATSWRKIVQLSRELNLEQSRQCDVETAQQEYDKAIKARLKAKEEAPEWHVEHANTLAKSSCG